MLHFASPEGSESKCKSYLEGKQYILFSKGLFFSIESLARNNDFYFVIFSSLIYLWYLYRQTSLSSIYFEACDWHIFIVVINLYVIKTVHMYMLPDKDSYAHIFFF